MNTKKFLTCMAVVAFTSVNAFADGFTIESISSLSAGESTKVSVILNTSTDGVNSCGFILTLPDGFTVKESASTGNPILSKGAWVKDMITYYEDEVGEDFDWSQTFSKNSDGQSYTYTGYSLNYLIDKISDGEMATFTIIAADDVKAGTYTATITGQEYTTGHLYDANPLSTTKPTNYEFTITVPSSGGTDVAVKTTGTTFCSASAVEIPTGVTAYIVKTITSTSATLTQIEGVIPANTGVILKAETAGTFTFAATTSTGADCTGNKLVGVTTDTEMSSIEKAYVLSGGEFHPCDGGTLAAGKAYLDCSGVEGLAKAITFSFNDAETGISNITFNEDATNAPIYNLNGMRVQKAQKGIYIRNGKKYVVE